MKNFLARRYYLIPFILLVLACGETAFASAAPGYGRVELLRDSWGVPHVFADTDEGAMYGLGYATAEDRGFQMHYFLRMMQGRMTEVFGDIEKHKAGGTGPKTTLEHDRVMRMFGFVQAADRAVRNLDSETLGLLEAYSAGVNDYFAKNADDEHYLFDKIGLQREAWKPADCILSWWHFAQFFSKNGLRDTPSLKPQAPRRPAPGVFIDDDAAVVRREDVSQQWIDKVNAWMREAGLTPRKPRGPGSPDPKFSHAWVVGGGKSTTGSSVLVSDPQTPVWNPSFLYEFHFQGKTFNVRGIGVAGSPIILIGFNGHVAWGMTALGADQADIFILDTDAAHPDQYRVDGKWLDMNRRRETIRIKDAQPERMIVRETIFGPIASQFVWRNPEGQEVAVCRVPLSHTRSETIAGAMGMIRAGSCDEFAAALPGWSFPSANCIFGDSQGNIGYWSLGALPVRSSLTGFDGGHAQDGSTRRGMWQGMIPYDILPHCINPKRGYLVSANHRTIQSFYKVPFGNMTGSSGDTDRGLRVKERIAEHLAENDRLAPEDVLAIHYDSVNVWKREIVHLGLMVLDRNPEKLSPNSEKALEYLKPWYANGAATDLSVPGTELVNEMNVIFRGGVFGLVRNYGGGVSGLARFAKTVSGRYAANPDAPVPDDECTFADQVLAQAWTRARNKYGADTSTWNKQARRALCKQKLGYMDGLDGFGSLDERYDVRLPLLKTIDGATVLSQEAQSYTQFVPLHDVDASMSILPMGSSDNPKSPYRFSTYGDWAQGRLHPAPLSRKAVEKIAVLTSTLRPGPQVRGAGTAARRQSARRGPAQSEEPKLQLPGKKPDDPTLEMAIRYLNRAERTEQEVKDKIDELRSYVRGDRALKAELIDGLELFIHLMKESQAGRIHIRYGTPTTLKLIEAFYAELTSDGSGRSAGAKPHGRMEVMHPDDLEEVLAKAPVAYVPLGTFEHHGWHLPICFDGIKAHALCERIAQRTGGAVLPTFFYGTGGGHIGYKWTLILDERKIRPLLEATLDHLAMQGFKVVVVLTGHYPHEQVDMVHQLASEAGRRHPDVTFIGLAEREVTTPQPGDRGSGDHAAKYETSIGMDINPAWVRMDALTEGRNPASVTLPTTPKRNAPTHDARHPLYAVYGQDPRTAASPELGKKVTTEIVNRLATQVEEALAR
ncbi:MAG: penicillin acylase family protein [Planctomycetota bacterium]